MVVLFLLILWLVIYAIKMRKAQVTISEGVSATAYGYALTDNINDVLAWHNTPTFEIPEGTWYFFTRFSNGSYDVQKKTIICPVQCSFEMIITRINNIQCVPISFDQSRYVRQCSNVTLFTVAVKDNLDQLVEFEINNSGIWVDATNGNDTFVFTINPPALNVSIKARVKGCTNIIGQSLLTCLGDPDPSECTFSMSIENITPVVPPENTLAYAFPPLNTGNAWLDANGNPTLVMIKLQLDLNTNGYVLKDLAYNSSLAADTQNCMKKYSIGFTNKFDVSTAFLMSDLQNGINVNAYAGREITVTAFWHRIDNFDLTNGAAQQTIYIPPLPNQNVGVYNENGTTVYEYPNNRVFTGQKKSPYFDDYINDLGLGDAIVTTEISRTDSSWEDLGLLTQHTIHVTKKMISVADDWLTNDLEQPHPYNNNIQPQYIVNNPDGSLNFGASKQNEWNAWKQSKMNESGGTLEDFQNLVIAKFLATFNPLSGYRYVFINNEIKTFWDYDMHDTVRSAIIQHISNAPSYHRIIGWAQSLISVPATFYMDTDGAWSSITGKPNVRVAAWNDLNYSSGGDFNNYYNWTGRNLTAEPSYKQNHGYNLIQNGGYINSLFEYYHVYTIMVEALLNKKHGINKQTVNTFFLEIETINSFGMVNIFLRKQNKTYQTVSKLIVGSEIAYAVGAVNAFFNPSGMIHVWQEALIRYNDYGDNIYPRLPDGNVFEVTSSGSIAVTLPTNNTGFVPANTVTPLNSLIDGIWAVFQNKTILDTTEVQLGEVLVNGSWKTGYDASPYVCAKGNYPVIAYRRSNNIVLVLIYQYSNHIIKDVTFRLITGEQKTVTLKGCFPKIIKYTL